MGWHRKVDLRTFWPAQWPPAPSRLPWRLFHTLLFTSRFWMYGRQQGYKRKRASSTKGWKKGWKRYARDYFYFFKLLFLEPEVPVQPGKLLGPRGMPGKGNIHLPPLVQPSRLPFPSTTLAPSSQTGSSSLCASAPGLGLLSPPVSRKEMSSEEIQSLTRILQELGTKPTATTN